MTKFEIFNVIQLYVSYLVVYYNIYSGNQRITYSAAGIDKLGKDKHSYAPQKYIILDINHEFNIG